MLKVLMNGCNGTMGQVLSGCIEEIENMKIVGGVSRNPEKYKNTYPVYRNILDIKEDVDVVIDFSNPTMISSVLDYGLQTKTPIVIATTGLSDSDIHSIKDASRQIPVFYSANTSLGVNVLIEIVKRAAVILNDAFDIEIIEKHHNKKIDAPSGTAYMIANAINEELSNSMEYVYGREDIKEKRTKDEIGIHAVRGGTIAGEHAVLFAGMDEIIEIKHTAMSKNIFAQGAIKAAKFIVNKENGFYNMDNLINLKGIDINE